jgi:hypothetical protein
VLIAYSIIYASLFAYCIGNIHFCFVFGSKWCRLCYFIMYFGFWFEIVYCFNWFWFIMNHFLVVWNRNNR